MQPAQKPVLALHPLAQTALAHTQPQQKQHVVLVKRYLLVLHPHNPAQTIQQEPLAELKKNVMVLEIVLQYK